MVRLRRKERNVAASERRLDPEGSPLLWLLILRKAGTSREIVFKDPVRSDRSQFLLLLMELEIPESELVYFDSTRKIPCPEPEEYLIPPRKPILSGVICRTESPSASSLKNWMFSPARSSGEPKGFIFEVKKAPKNTESDGADFQNPKGF